MNVFVSKNQKVSASVLVFCSPDAEYAATFVDAKDLASNIESIIAILASALTKNVYSLTTRKNHQLIDWASKTSGNFIWLATFAKYLEFEHRIHFGTYPDSYEALASVTHDIHTLLVGDFEDVPNIAFCPIHGIDYRSVPNPYIAYQMLVKDLASAV